MEVETFLEHYGVKGMRWGKRKARDSGSDASGGNGGAAPKQSRRERRKTERQARFQADMKKAEGLLEKSLKEPKTLIKLNGHMVVTGNEFAQYMSSGGLLNVRTTEVFAEFDKKANTYVRA